MSGTFVPMSHHRNLVDFRSGDRMDRSGLVDRADLEPDLLGGEALVDVDADRGCAVNAARLLRPPEKKLTGIIEIVL